MNIRFGPPEVYTRTLNIEQCLKDTGASDRLLTVAGTVTHAQEEKLQGDLGSPPMAADSNPNLDVLRMISPN